MPQALCSGGGYPVSQQQHQQQLLPPPPPIPPVAARPVWDRYDSDLDEESYLANDEPPQLQQVPPGNSAGIHFVVVGGGQDRDPRRRQQQQQQEPETSSAPDGVDKNVTFDEKENDELMSLCYQVSSMSSQQQGPTTTTSKTGSGSGWDMVRDWLMEHGGNWEYLHASLETCNEAGQTPLHVACQRDVPLDILDFFLLAHDTVAQKPDSSGWLALHYACAFCSDARVIASLEAAYPDSKLWINRKGLTPLVYALIGSFREKSHVVALLSNTGAAHIADALGMTVRICYSQYFFCEPCCCFLCAVCRSGTTHDPCVAYHSHRRRAPLF
jgi:hypothetical protein